MAAVKFYIQVAVMACLLITFSESCNVGLGNLGVGNIGVGNLGLGNKGVLNRGALNTGALNQKSVGTTGVGNYRRFRKVGVLNMIALPNLMPTG